MTRQELALTVAAISGVACAAAAGLAAWVLLNPGILSVTLTATASDASMARWVIWLVELATTVLRSVG